jgi:hypothetical protein
MATAPAIRNRTKSGGKNSMAFSSSAFSLCTWAYAKRLRHNDPGSGAQGTWQAGLMKSWAALRRPDSPATRPHTSKDPSDPLPEPESDRTDSGGE